MKIILIRHALSALNAKLIKHHDMPNHQIPIVDPDGKNQALAVGKQLGSKFLSEAILYQSPYTRTRQTMAGILEGAGYDPKAISGPTVFPKIYEDPRLREVDFGYGDPEEQKPIREKEGYFWYRMDGGESAADCFDRVATFLDTMKRQIDRKKGHNGTQRDVVIVTHGLIIRCFVMRFMHLTVEQFDSTDTPDNCSITTLDLKVNLKAPQFVSGKWGVEGIKGRHGRLPSIYEPKIDYNEEIKRIMEEQREALKRAAL